MKRILSVIIGIIFIACGAGVVILSGYLVFQGHYIGLLLGIIGVSLLATGVVIVTKGDAREAFLALFSALGGAP